MDNTYDPLFVSAGQQWNVDPALLKTVYGVESSGNANTQDSSAGASGGMQLMPKTAAALGVKNPKDMSEAVPAAAHYLRMGLDATGSPEGALAFYHGGPDHNEWGPQTQAYITKARALYPNVSVQAGGNMADTQDDADTTAGMALLNAATPSAKGAAPNSTTTATPSAKSEPIDADTAAGMALLNAAQTPTGPPNDTVQATAAKMPAVDSGMAAMRSEAGQSTPAQPAQPAQQGYLSPSGDWIPPEAMPTPQQAKDMPDITEGTPYQSVADAAGSAYYNTPSILNPEFAKNHPTLAANADAATGMLRSFNAIMAGGQQAVAEGGNALAPGLGNAIVTGAQAVGADRMATMGVGSGYPAPASRLDVGSIGNKVPAQPAEVVPEGTPTAATYTVAPPDRAPLAGEMATQADKVDALQRRFNQSPADRQTAGVDNTNYLNSDVMPSVLERQPNAANAAKYQVLIKADGSDVRANQAAMNDARIDYARNLDLRTPDEMPNSVATGPDTNISANREKQLTDARQGAKEVNLESAFDDRLPVDATPIVQRVQQMLAPVEKGGEGLADRDAVARPLIQVLDKLTAGGRSADGLYMADPKALYVIKQSIGDMLDKDIPDNAANRTATSQLTQIQDHLDTKIAEGDSVASAQKNLGLDWDPQRDPVTNTPVGGYQYYQEQFQKMSQPINEIKALRNAGFGDLQNRGATLRQSDVDEVLGKLIEGAGNRDATDPAKSVSDAAWNGLFNLRNDIARSENVLQPGSGNVRPRLTQPSDIASAQNALYRSPLRTAAAIAAKLGSEIVTAHFGGPGLGGALRGTVAGLAGDAATNRLMTGINSRASARTAARWSGDLLNRGPVEVAPDLPPDLPVPTRRPINQLWGDTSASVGGSKLPPGKTTQSADTKLYSIPGDDKASVRFSHNPDSNQVDIHHINRGALPAGSGTPLALDALRQNGLTKPDAVSMKGIINQPTLDALRSGAAPESTDMGKLLGNVVQGLGGRGGDIGVSTEKNGRPTFTIGGIKYDLPKRGAPFGQNQAVAGWRQEISNGKPIMVAHDADGNALATPRFAQKLRPSQFFQPRPPPVDPADVRAQREAQEFAVRNRMSSEWIDERRNALMVQAKQHAMRKTVWPGSQ